MEDGEGRNKKKTTKKNKKEGNRKRPKEEEIVVKKEKISIFFPRDSTDFPFRSSLSRVQIKIREDNRFPSKGNSYLKKYFQEIYS